VAIGDVSGKGPAAALIAAMLQGMFSLVGDARTGPGEVVSRLNRALCQRNIAPRYATFFYGVLEPDGRLTYSNAGHPPPLLVTATGVHPLTAGGPILGVFESAAFPCETVTLAPGDTLVCYSDGVTDAEAPGGVHFGLDRLVAATRACGAAPPRQFVEGLLTAVRDFSDTASPTDDATIAVLRYR
jgi:sigma-B regulation protein RsbU (phosphoserine phosphatase)